MMITKKCFNNYEAAYYLIHGAQVESFEIRSVARNAQEKLSRGHQWIFTLTNIPEFCVRRWRDHKAFANVSEIEAKRNYLKLKVKKTRGK